MRFVLPLCAAVAVLSGALGAVGCRPDDAICGTRTEEVAAAEGGPARCVRADDCPREGAVQVCVTDGWPEEPCVRCREARCERVVPEACE